MSAPARITLEDGKYTVINDNGVLSFQRYEAPWPAADDLKHSGVVLALVQEVERLRSAVSEVHSWIVCAAIASPEDMMQSAARIEEITRP